MLTNKDLQQIEQLGLHENIISRQLDTFIKGIPFTHVVTAASVGNGIEVIGLEDQHRLIDLYDHKREGLDLVKFVPASGAATRMFSFLYKFLDEFNPEEQKLKNFLKSGNHKQLEIFLDSLKEFAFVSAIRKKVKKHFPEYKHGTKGMRAYLFVSLMLGNKGLNFSKLPKGLIPFHKYSKYSTTAFEEQLYEAAFYASSGNEVFTHFTFSKIHLPYFKNEFEGVKNRVSKKTKKKFHVSYSFQDRNTDTVAVTHENKPIRNGNGELIFRPSGHGALLENLNQVDADLIFIKNIDNVASEDSAEHIAFYKKMLAGKLLWLQKKLFNYLEILLSEDFNIETLKDIKSFLWNELNIKNIPESITEITAILNRPLRVCGVVKNTGAPGGGPFWVKNESGNISLQIVELVQIDKNNTHQTSVVNEATHFNPVDIVCGIRDYKGKKFDLSLFSDPEAGLISSKIQNGIPLKILELPGLWNGGMAYWNTAMVEVPLSTFNPVKTVNDLLSKEHRPKL
ncbi:DUF4301 family protein [Ulvibacter antarcticus]|uniref:Uncharacterized protein DUF4301 n=1 Tax=Ulvibacter antarcticus TaxID=442714 RepID=A0A3L9Z1C5_9FLAO|nr:DUF4301 family protein [Ulvibacter antarcticus]RMA66314.1 uncharacterized protein DUF4301 [Ulvibacter antarcticus]